MLQRLVFLLKTSPTRSKTFEYDQIKIIGLKDVATKSLKREKGKTINCHYPDISWNPGCLFLWSFLTICSLFSTDFQLSSRMLIFRKQTRKQRIFFSLAFPSLNTSISFIDGSKNSEHIKTFWEARRESHPPKIQKSNFQKVNSQNGKVSKLFP